MPVEVLALIAAYNEARFLGGCVEHLIEQGVRCYVIDNESTDDTAEVARRYLGRGVVGIESFPRAGVYPWRALLRRKEALAATLPGDWFMHVDADECHVAPPGFGRLSEAFARVDDEGFTAVDFAEFTFLPVEESPDHDHPDFRRTLRWYYPFADGTARLVRAWKRVASVELAWSGGHRPRFAGLSVYPEQFRMRHYIALSRAHVIRKYAERSFDPTEVANGWHGWRARLTADRVRFPSERTLRVYVSDDELDGREPRARHYFADLVDGTSGD